MNEAESASTLFSGAEAAAEPAAAEPQPGSDEAIAAVLYAEEPTEESAPVPANIKALRASEESLYSAADAFADVDFELEGAEADEYRCMLGDLGLSGHDGKALVNEIKRYSTNPPTDEERQEWRELAERRLREMNTSPAEWEAAQQLARRDPRTAAILDHTGLGNHPDTVLEFVRLARQEKIRGRACDGAPTGEEQKGSFFTRCIGQSQRPNRRRSAGPCAAGTPP